MKLSDAQIREATAHTMCPGCGHLIEADPFGGVMCTNTACPAWRRVLREPEHPGRSLFNDGVHAIEPTSRPYTVPALTPPTRHEPNDAERATERLAASPPSWASPLGWRLAVMAEAEWYAKRFGGRLARGKREVSTLRRIAGLPAGAQYRGEDSDFCRTLRVYHRCRLEGMPHDAAKEVAAEEMWLLDKGFIDQYARGLEQYARGLEKPAPRLQRPRANDGRRTLTCRLVGDGNDTYR